MQQMRKRVILGDEQLLRLRHVCIAWRARMACGGVRAVARGRVGMW